MPILLTNERETETIIDQILKNKGWIDDPRSPERTVWKQGVKTKKQQKAIDGKRPDYVLYQKRSTTPLAVIEAKAQGKNIHTALEQGIQYARKIGAPLVFATDGVFTKSFHIVCNDSLFLNDEEIHELINYDLTLRYLSTSNLSTLTKKVQKSRGELIAVFSKANDLLREEGLQAGIERFSEFSTLLFLKIFSEMEQIRLEKGDKERTKNDFLWNSFKDETGNKLLNYVNDTVIQWFANEYEKDVFQKLSIKNPDNLKEIIDLLSELQLTDTDVDIKGDAFEYFIKAYSASNLSDLGEIFTPRHIVKTMVKLLNPRIGETVYDPFCGTGGMLIVAFKHIRESMAFTDFNMGVLKKKTLYGTELTKTARIAKMNMILAGDGHTNIVQRDSFQNPEDQKYDIIITNYPFAQKTRYGDLYPIPSRNGDVIAPQHCFQALKEGGRMAFIAPEGFLFRQDRALRDVRKFLLENANLKSIISLPQGCFLPYNGVKASILYFDEIRRAKTKEYFFFYDVKNDGFTLDKRRTKIEGANDLETVLSESDLTNANEKYLQDQGIHKISLRGVKENDYSLACSQLVQEHKVSNSEWPMVELMELFDKKILFYMRGIPIKKSQTLEGKIPVIAGGRSSAYYHNKATVLEECITISASGAYSGHVLYHSNPIWASDCTVLQGNKSSLSTKYLFFILRSIQKKIYSLQHGSGQPHVYWSDLRKLKIPLPIIQVQEVIVKELDSYQKIIDGCRQVVENYKPVIEIDPRWDMVELGKVCCVCRGGSPRPIKSYITEDKNGLNWLKIGDISKSDKYITSTKSKIKPEGLKKTRFIKKGSLILSNSMSFGRPYILKIDTCIHDGWISLKDLLNIINIEFLFYILKIENTQKQFQFKATGSTVKNLNINKVKKIKIPLPSIEVQQEIVSKIEKEQEAIDHCKWLIETYNKKIQDRIDKVWNVQR